MCRGYVPSGYGGNNVFVGPQGSDNYSGSPSAPPPYGFRPGGSSQFGEIATMAPPPPPPPRQNYYNQPQPVYSQPCCVPTVSGFNSGPMRMLEPPRRR